jgi:hypothetical protein
MAQPIPPLKRRDAPGRRRLRISEPLWRGPAVSGGVGLSSVVARWLYRSGPDR